MSFLHTTDRRSPVILTCALLAWTLFNSCGILAGRAQKPMRNEVFVMGTLHGDHLTDELYSLERLGDLLRQLDPDVVLVEIPPDRFEESWNQFLQTGEVTEERVKLYPEFTEVLFPIALEGRFRIEPCSAWTQKMSDRRAALLKQWKSTRATDSQQVADARAAMERELESRGLAHDPLQIHTEDYDAIVAQGMEPYERIFGNDLGTGGWHDINLAHYTLVSAALDRVTGNDQRVLVMFGAWHKYRLRELMADREDIHLLRLPQVVR
jgi:hypothetical protein